MSEEILHALDKIGEISGKKAKEEHLRVYLEEVPGFRKVVIAAVNPFITYGITTDGLANFQGEPAAFPALRSHDFHDDNHMVWAILDKLAKRELTGNEALATVKGFTINCLSGGEMILLGRILDKDLRAGFGASTLNKIEKGMIPTFDCMLAHKYEQKRIKDWPVAVEPKLDGVRVLAFVIGESVTFYSRSGKEFTAFNHLKKHILDMMATNRINERGFGDVVLDGEVVSGSFNNTVSVARRKNVQATDAEFHIFDYFPFRLWEEGVKVNEISYSDRRKQLIDALESGNREFLKVLPSYLANSHEEIVDICASAWKRNLEGVIVKPRDGIYERKRSHNWLKIKAEESVDVPIIDMEPGTGKFEGKLGALVVDYNGVKVNVGSGLSDVQRQEFWEEGEKLFGRLIEVEFHEVTPDGSLRHPRFKRFRDDKARAA